MDTRLSFKVRLHQMAPSSRQDVACLVGYFLNPIFNPRMFEELQILLARECSQEYPKYLSPC